MLYSKTAWILLALATASAPLSAMATGSESHSGQAIIHSGQASGHGAISGAQVVSGIAAVPLVSAGAAGSAATTSANALIQAEPGTPLDVSDEVITAGPSPDQMLGNKK